MSSLQERIRTMVNRYTDPTNIPDAIRLLAEASVEITELKNAVEAASAALSQATEERAGVQTFARDQPRSDEPFEFWYTNHQGKIEQRLVVPVDIWYGETEYYEGPRWFLKARCMKRGAERDFAMDRITDKCPPFHGLTADQAERYFLAMDEMAGCVQKMSRVLRHGPDSFDPRGTPLISNRVDVANEMGRVQAAFNRLIVWGDVKLTVVEEANSRSARRAAPWMHHQIFPVRCKEGEGV